MLDLLIEARELRRKLYCLEVLIQIEKGKRSKDWFAGRAPKDSERPKAVKRLSRTGLIEAAPSPHHFRLTSAGEAFLANVRAKIAAEGRVDWTRVNEVDFPKL